MKKTILSLLIVLFVATSFLVSCGGGGGSDSGSDSDSGGSSGGDVMLSSVKTVPDATAQVVDSDGSTVLYKVEKPEMGFDGDKDDEWVSGMSHAACETYNQISMIFDHAARADEHMCYMKKDLDLLAEASGVNYKDGKWHIIDLNYPAMKAKMMEKEEGDKEEGDQEEKGEPKMGPPTQIKVKIDEDNQTFALYTCRDEKLEMFVKAGMSEDTLKMTIKHAGQFEDERFFDKMTIEGIVEKGNFVDQKTITAYHKSVREGDDQDQKFEGAFLLEQFVDSIYLQGNFKAQGEIDLEFCNFNDKIKANAEMIDNNAEGTDDFKLGKLELGAGAVMGSKNIICDDVEFASKKLKEAWDVNFSPINFESSSFAETLLDSSLEVATGEENLGFGEDAYDCKGTAEATLDFEKLMEAKTVTEEGFDPSECQANRIEHQYMQCHLLMPKGEKEEEEGKDPPQAGFTGLGECEGDPASDDPVNETNIEALCDCMKAPVDSPLCKEFTDTDCFGQANMGLCVKEWFESNKK